MVTTRVTGYDRALLELQTKSIELSNTVKELLIKAVGALEGKESLKDWRAADDAVDRVRDEIVNRSFSIMSLQQLRPQDLRWILGYHRIAHELERIADYACDLAELNTLKSLGAWSDKIILMAGHLMEMFEYAEGILKGSREIESDLDDQDDVLDQAYIYLQNDLVNPGREEAQGGSLALCLLLARNLERMGDHLVNIAEMVLYIKTGKRMLSYGS